LSDALLAEQPTELPTELPTRSRRPLSSRTLTIVGGGLILILAVGLRVYQFRDVPRLTDETDEVMRGLAIARGEMLPLTNVDAYIGPLWSYLLALGFLVAGPSSLLPRIVTLLASLATVAATAWLGRELALLLGWRDRTTLLALGGALLLATSSFHAIVSSRIAWSHALTPLCMTTCLALLIRWQRTRQSVALAGVGLMYGLAVHTHPTALALAPGLGIWALLHWRQTLTHRAGWAALGLFLLANVPMLAFNLSSGFKSASAAAQVQGAYAGGAPTTPAGYLANLGTLLASWPLLLSGEIGEHRGVMVALDGPLLSIYAGLALAGLAVVAWRRVSLPILLVLSAACVLPLVNGKYEPLFNGRYLAPLLPLAFVLAEIGVVAIVDRVPPLRARASLVTAGMLALMTIPPVLALNGYIQATLRDGPNNLELYDAAEITAATGPRGPVLVDASLSGTRQSTGREGTGVLEYLLILDQHLDVRRAQPNDLLLAVERGQANVVVVSPRVSLRLNKDFITEAPPGEVEARRRRRAGFVVVRIVGPA
jgi:4-amino-4-deoxy-L-arabinose transferase-like glycosyltransferase